MAMDLYQLKLVAAPTVAAVLHVVSFFFNVVSIFNRRNYTASDL